MLSASTGHPPLDPYEMESNLVYLKGPRILVDGASRINLAALFRSLRMLFKFATLVDHAQPQIDHRD